jgi:hypothetical protein
MAQFITFKCVLWSAQGSHDPGLPRYPLSVPAKLVKFPASSYTKMKEGLGMDGQIYGTNGHHDMRSKECRPPTATQG